jgi:proteasome lid subunit RPN8/RPN11
MAISIKVKGERLPEPVEMPPPGERRGTVLREKGQPLPELRVYIRDDVLKAMHKRAREAGDYEVGGFYLGGLHRYEGRRYVDITVQVPAFKAESARAQLTFSNDAQKQFHEIMEKEHAGELVLGWYHTHPGYGVFLSSYDMFIHQNFYAREYHTAIVIDPHASGPVRDVGVFVWENSKISRPYGLIVYGKEE